MMSLADQVLALHRDIQEVFILEDRGGEHVVIAEASRSSMRVLADCMDTAAKRGIFAPMMILGAAGQFSGMPTRLVGLGYDNVGIVFAPIDETRSLALSTGANSLHEVMRVTSEALPRLRELAMEDREKIRAITSAVQAEESARGLLAAKLPVTARIRVDEVAFRAADQRWEVYGSCQSQPWTLSRKFEVEVDSSDGSIKEFSYSSSSRLLLVEFVCLLAAGLLALGMLLFWR